MSSIALHARPAKASPLDALQRWLPKLVLAPSIPRRLRVGMGRLASMAWSVRLGDGDGLVYEVFRR